jgi:O-antigen ligase
MSYNDKPAPTSLAERAYFVLALFLLCATPWVLGRQEQQLNAASTVLVSGEGDPAKQAVFLAVYASGAVLLLMRVRLRQILFLGTPLLLLAIWCLASTFWSVNPAGTARRLVALYGTIAVGVYAGVRFDLQEFLRLFTIAAAALLTLSIIVAAVAPSQGLDPEGRLRGVLSHKNFLSSICSITILTVLVRLTSKFDRRKSTKAWLMILALLAVFCLVLSRSNGPVPALIAAVVVLFLVHLARTSDGRFRAVLPLALVSAGVGAFIIVPLIGGAELLGKSSDLSGRTDIWQFAATMIERNPWLGYGYKVFWLGENAPAAPFWKASRNFVPHAHDGYLETTLDVGLIGLSLYLAAAVSLAIKSIRILQRRVDTLFLWIVGYLVFSLIVNIGEVRLWEANDLHTILFIFAVVHTNKEFSSILGRVPAKSKVTARAFEQSASPVPSVEISR